MFVEIGGPDGNPSPNGGAVTPVAPLGADTSAQAAFDIAPDNTGYAALTVGGVPQLIRISLTTGPVPVGTIGDGSVGIRGRAVLPPPVAGLFAVTRANELPRFNRATPGNIASSTPITGLEGGEKILGLAVRPATGQLYALGNTSRLYTINPTTGGATQVGSGTFAVPLSGTSFGFTFDPVADKIRVV